MTENTKTYFFILVLVFSSFVSERRTAKLNAISTSPYTELLYHRLRNSRPPTRDDPATSRSADTRKCICQDITESGFFDEYAMESLEMTETAANEIRRLHPSIYRKIYVPRENLIKRLYRPYKYKNNYLQRKLKTIFHIGEELSTTMIIKEWVFICLLKSWFDNEEITPLYVSKEYNVSDNNSSYVAGRFIFWKDQEMILAEVPGQAYISPDYNIEVHYLQQRELHQSAQHDQDDPVCKLARGNVRNQHHRLCTTVLRSSYFNGRIHHVVPVHSDYKCLESRMSFQTTQAVEQISHSREYHERVLPCLVVEKTNNEPPIGVRRALYYLSRAYTSNQVFVYTRPLMRYPAHLEVLITNVSMVHETINDQRFIRVSTSSDDSVQEEVILTNTLNVD